MRINAFLSAGMAIWQNTNIKFGTQFSEVYAIDEGIVFVGEDGVEYVWYADSGEISIREPDDEPPWIDDDCGFDPYLGCYSEDC